MPLILPVLLAVVVAAITFHVRLARLTMAGTAGRVGPLAVQCFALASLMPVAAFAVMSLGETFNGGVDHTTLGLMPGAPWPTCGSPAVAAGFACRSWRALGWPTLIVAFPVWELAVVGAVLWRVAGLDTSGVAVTGPEGAARSTPSSSRP